MHTIMHINSPPERRRDIILERLAEDQPVMARQLAEEFGVSEDAIRRDLRDLAEAGKCRRVYGGALPLNEASPFVERVDRDFPAKRALARAAAALIEPDQTIYIDAGTTHLLLAESLTRGRPVTVITNSIAVASAVYRRPEIKLFLIGGAVDPELDGALGATAAAQIAQYRPALTFIGACAADPVAGISALDDREAELKRTAAASSQRLVALVTNDKLGRIAPHHVVASSALDTLIVEHDAPEALCAGFEAAGVTVIRAVRAPDLMPRHAG
ncbi:DeoR/GlpR family DNA-binding transcription regulator [Brevundimonas sp.]|jgi:DeoR/GlpR family transcriptional regulator of sugar metabolism|uniref:DeoR/GlpR family DNA-binding transcription regulator n=1 Tax=Brevundimonas sp. TaxID=1871086 RepID=UPI0037C0176D